MSHASPGKRLVFGTHGIWPAARLWPLRRTLRLRPAEYLAHLHTIGKTKSGKSNFLAHLIPQLIAAGVAVTLIDPHGDLAHLILANLVASGFFSRDEAFHKLLFLDIARADRAGRYLPFNVLDQPHLRNDSIASNVREAFHRAWPELSQGAATFDTLFVDGTLLLLHNALPLTALRALLTNDTFRAYLLSRETDKELVASFADVYEQLRKHDQVQYAGSVLRRARQLTQLDVLRYGLGQRENRLNFRTIMDAGQSVFVKLDVQNDDAKRLLGCFLTVACEQAAKSRAEIPAYKRTGQHILVIDECQLFIAQDTSTLDEILSETRKYGLHLWMANQTMSQIPERLRGGLQNIGLQAVFRVGAADAHYLANEIAYVDLAKIKHQVVDPTAVERTHPLFDRPEEQRLSLAQEMQNFLPGQAYLSWYAPVQNALKRAILRRPAMRLVKIRTPQVKQPENVARRMQAIEDWYLREYFRRPQEENRDIPQDETPAYTQLFAGSQAQDIDSEG